MRSLLNPQIRELGLVIGAAWLLAGFAQAQSWRYVYNLGGSLVTRTTNSVALPVIRVQPQPQIVAPGELASFSVVAADTAGLGYQWRFNNANLPGQTNDTLLLVNVTTNNQGPYSVVLSNSSGSVTSAAVQLYIDSDRDGLPDSWEQTNFGNLTSQRSGGDADGDGVSNANEFFDGTNPTDKASRKLRLTLYADGGSVAPAPTKPSYTNGESITLTAAPFPPNAFYSWTGDLVARTNPATLIMNSNKAVVAHFRCDPAPYGIVGWWRGENDALDAVGGNNGALSNGLSFAQGQVGQAFLFNAANQEVRVASSPALNVGTGAGLTIETWIKPANLGAEYELVEWNNGTTIGAHFSINVGFSGQGGPGCLYANLRDINGADHYLFSAAGLLSTSVWQHVAVTYDRTSGIARLFLNGQTVGSASLGNFVPRTAFDLHLGFRPGYISYVGLLDEPAIYNRALTQPEIFAIAQADGAGKCNDRPIFIGSAQFADATQGSPYTQQVPTVRGTAPVTYSLSAGTLPAGLTLSASGSVSGVPTVAGSNTFAVLATDAAGLSTELISGLRVLPSGPPAIAPGLVSWWRAENNALDSASTNHGVLTNGTIFAAGRVGQAFSFNGITNYVQVGNIPELNFSNVLSLEAWIFPTGAGSAPNEGGTIICKENQYEIARFADGTIRWAFANTSPGWNWISTGFVAPLNQWTHIVVVYDNGVVTTYGNGVLVQSFGGVGPIGFAQVGQNDFRIGGRQSFNQYFQGRIDEASVYRSVLTSNEVAALFSAGAGGKVVVGPYINTGSRLPDAVSGQGYTQAITAIRGTSPINFTLTAGALPAGLTLSAAGVLSGTPSATGEFGFAITVTDANGLNNRQAFTLQVYTRTPPPAGLIGWWRAENNPLDSAGANNGALLNGTTFAAGKVGQAFSFDGVNDSFEIPDAPAVRPTSLTVEAWIFANSLNSSRIIFAKPLGTIFQDSYALWLENGTLRGVVQDMVSSGPILTVPFPSVPGQWHHVAYSFDNSTKQQVLYIDGAPVASGVANQTIGYDSHPLLLGRDDNNGSPGEFFAGHIDEAALYDRALGDDEIRLIYYAGPGGKTTPGPNFATPPTLPAAVAGLNYTQAIATVRSTAPVTLTLAGGILPGGMTFSSGGILGGTPTNVGSFAFTVRARDAAGITTDQQFTLPVLPKVSPPAGLVAWWRAEDNLLDAAGTSDGVLVNGATFAPGKVGRAFSLDGLDDTIEIADAPPLHPSSLTLESWVLFFGTGGSPHIIAKPLGSGGADSFVIWYVNGTLRAFIADATGGADLLSAPFTPVVGRWYHVAFTFDDNSKEQRLYVDGAAVAAGYSSRSIGYDNHPVLLGSDIENGILASGLWGRIDETAIYNRALGAGEIAELFNASAAGKTTAGPYFATAPELSPGVLGQNYTQSFSAMRATLPITVGLVSGSLPGGLTLSPSGALSGTPKSIGSFSFTLRVTDATGLSGEQTFALEVFRQVAPPAGLISWWRAENNGLDSAGANHGIVTNGTSYAAGQVGRAFALDGVNDYVQIADAASLRPASVTLETWVQFAAAGTRVLVGKPVGGGTSDSYQIYLSAGNLGAFVGDAGGPGTQFNIPFTPVLGQWYHVAYTFDDTTLQQVLYLDGVTVASGLGSKRIGYDNQPVLLGVDIDNGSRAYFLSGRLDETAIYNRALTAEEIAAIYHTGAGGKTTAGPYFTSTTPLPPGIVGRTYSQTITTVRGAAPVVISRAQGELPNGITLSPGGSLSGIPSTAGEYFFVLRAADAAGKFAEQLYALEIFAPLAPPSGLLAWWKGDNDALDSAGTNHGTLFGGATFAAGKVNSAFDFNGTSAYVAFPNSSSLNPTGAFSVEAWIKASPQQFSADRYFMVVDKSHGCGDGTGWLLLGNPNGTMQFAFGKGGTPVPANFPSVSGFTSVLDDHWHHVVGVFTGTQLALYQDGLLVNAVAVTDLPAPNTRNVEIGRWCGSPTRAFHGLIDEVSFYGRALSEAEISSIYNAGPAGKLATSTALPLVLRASLQGGVVVIAFDAIIGRAYTVQSAPGIPGEWTTLSSFNALQKDVTFTDAITNAQQRYFRVVTSGN